MKYIKKYISGSDFVVIQDYENGYQREVFKERPAYLLWIAEGNIPEEIPYTPPELPDLASYKAAKTAEISAQTKTDIKNLDIYRSADILSKFTPEIQLTFTARRLYLLGKSELTEAEQAEVAYLISVYETAATMQTAEVAKITAVKNATSYAEVDAV